MFCDEVIEERIQSGLLSIYLISHCEDYCFFLTYNYAEGSLFVNYSTLTDGASCESSQPLRETFVLRSAVCRNSSSYKDAPSTWHSVIATLEVSQSPYNDSSNSIVLLPSWLPTLVRN